MTDTDVDAAVFRQLCGRFATGVVIVTTNAEDGRPVGMTANSFASVSLDPPLVSVNVDRGADMHRHLARATRFAVNVLESRQEALSRRFAGEHADRFEGVGYRTGETGLPLLDGVLADDLPEGIDDPLAFEQSADTERQIEEPQHVRVA